MKWLYHFKKPLSRTFSKKSQKNTQILFFISHFWRVGVFAEICEGARAAFWRSGGANVPAEPDYSVAKIRLLFGFYKLRHYQLGPQDLLFFTYSGKNRAWADNVQVITACLPCRRSAEPRQQPLRDRWHKKLAGQKKCAGNPAHFCFTG